MTTDYGTFLPRRGTTAQWAASSRILRDGEFGKDITTGELKQGNGINLWAALPGYLDSVALKAAYATYASLAAQPDSLFVGTIVCNADGVATSAPVVWPDGTAGVFTALTVNAAWPAVDSYSVTYAGAPTRTYTQPLVTRDATSGAVTARPAIVVT